MTKHTEASAEVVAWLQTGLGDKDGMVLVTTRQPKKYDPTWWKFEPLVRQSAFLALQEKVQELEARLRSEREKPKTRNYWRKQYELLGRVMWPNYEAAKKYDTGYIRWNVASIDAAIEAEKGRTE